MTKKDDEYKPKCIAVSDDTWNILRNHFGAENVIGYLILKVNVNRVTYSARRVNGLNTLGEDDGKVNLCLGTQIAEHVTLKCDDDAIDFFVNNHGRFVFRINYTKGVIREGSVRFEDLDWAAGTNHLKPYLIELDESKEMN